MIIRPKRPDNGGGQDGWRTASDNYLYLDGRTIASPAFRFLAWFDGRWTEGPNQAGGLGLFDLFCDRWASRLHSLTVADAAWRWRSTLASADALAQTRQAFASAGPGQGMNMRLAGWIDEPHHIEAAPCLCLYESDTVALMAIELPHDAPDLVGFADRVTDRLQAMNLVCGLAGYGFFMPDYLDSLSFALPMGRTRSATAIELTPWGGANCLTEAYLVSDPNGGQMQPGLPDIGWRTLIGERWHDRVPDLSALAEAGDVHVDRSGRIISITAGAAPIWGHVFRDEDLDPYRRVSQILRPLRVAPRVALRHLFGETGDDPERRERVRNYLNRFDV